METPTAWIPLPDVTSPCAGAVLRSGNGETTVRMLFSGVAGGGSRDLLVRFGPGVLAATSHDEFVDPWNTPERAATYSSLPRVRAGSLSAVYPMIEVLGSEWLASFTDGHILDFQRAAVRHFRFLSLDNTVDVLTTEAPTARWVPAET